MPLKGSKTNELYYPIVYSGKDSDLKYYLQPACVCSLHDSDIEPLRQPMSEVVTFYDSQLGAVERYYVLRSVSWLDDLASYQNHINKLTKEHESESEQLETPYSVVAQVESINAKHAEEDGENQGYVEVLAISKIGLKFKKLSQTLWICKLRVVARNRSVKCVVSRVRTYDPF